MSDRTLNVLRPETGRTLNCRIRKAMTLKRRILTERVSLAPRLRQPLASAEEGDCQTRYRTVRGTNAGQVLLDSEKESPAPPPTLLAVKEPRSMASCRHPMLNPDSKGMT